MIIGDNRINVSTLEEEQDDHWSVIKHQDKQQTFTLGMWDTNHLNRIKANYFISTTNHGTPIQMPKQASDTKNGCAPGQNWGPSFESTLIHRELLADHACSQEPLADLTQRGCEYNTDDKRFVEDQTMTWYRTRTRTGIPASWGLSNRFFSSVLLAWSDNCQKVAHFLWMLEFVSGFEITHLNLLRVSTVHHVDYGVDPSAISFPHWPKSELKEKVN